MSDKLRDTPPEARTAGDAIESAVISFTDFLDGLLTRGLPYSEVGREKDRLADRTYVLEQFEQLAENGEVPQIHSDVQAGREHVMKVVRWIGGILDKDLRSLQVNRAKTALNMAMLTTAHSPLATKEDLLRFEASGGTGASLTGLFETVFQYLSKDKSEDGTSDPRNSTAREVSAGPVGFITSLIDEHAPGVTPTHLTRTGELMVEGASALLAAKPDKKILATTLFAAGSMVDFLDGSLARLKGIASTKGMIEDVQADLRQQIAATAALSITAMRRGNKVAAANYSIAAMTTALSALTRAQAESQGLIVAEGGLGTRAGRGVLSGIGMALNDERDMSDVISSTLAVSTINTVYERQHVITHGADSEYCVGTNNDPKLIKEAEARRKAILPLAVAGMAIGGALLVANQTGIVEHKFGLDQAESDSEYDLRREAEALDLAA